MESRIPDIGEFIGGFKFDVYSDGYLDSVEDFCGWYSYTMGINNWRDIGEIKKELEWGNIRTWQ
jgi:hypothetical protein